MNAHYMYFNLQKISDLQSGFEKIGAGVSRNTIFLQGHFDIFVIAHAWIYFFHIRHQILQDTLQAHFLQFTLVAGT